MLPAVIRSLVAVLAALLLTVGFTGAASATGNGDSKGQKNGPSASADAAPGKSAESNGAEKSAEKSAESNGAEKSAEKSSESNGNGAEKSSSKGNGGSKGQSDHSQGNAGTSGNHDEPQPESNADKNDGGANAGECGTSSGGAYCSDRDGRASENGKGGGKAGGKPCAGCVGKADNKNPKGQQPDGSDHNAGYECDRNQGIGKGNPAHTGCPAEETPDEETPDEETPDEETPDEETPDEETPDGVEEEVDTPDEVAGVELSVPAPPSESAPVNRSAPTSGGVLPDTGAGQWIPLGLAGVLLLLGGTLLLRRGRPTVR